MRNLPENKKKLDLASANNDEVLYGEIIPDPVRVLNFMMDYIYDPLINSENNEDWGQSEE